jgi:hypothetical protein
MLDKLVFRINIVENCVRIPLMACGKDDNLEILIYHFKAFFCERPDVKSSLEYLARHRGNVSVDIRRLQGILFTNTVS